MSLAQLSTPWATPALVLASILALMLGISAAYMYAANGGLLKAKTGAASDAASDAASASAVAAERRSTRKKGKGKRKKRPEAAAGALDAGATTRPPAPLPRRPNSHAVLLVDFQNVRGSDGFSLTSAAFLSLLERFADAAELAGRVYAVVSPLP